MVYDGFIFFFAFLLRSSFRLSTFLFTRWLGLSGLPASPNGRLKRREQRQTLTLHAVRAHPALLHLSSRIRLKDVAVLRVRHTL